MVSYPVRWLAERGFKYVKNYLINIASSSGSHWCVRRRDSSSYDKAGVPNLCPRTLTHSWLWTAIALWTGVTPITKLQNDNILPTTRSHCNWVIRYIGGCPLHKNLPCFCRAMHVRILLILGWWTDAEGFAVAYRLGIKTWTTMM